MGLNLEEQFELATGKDPRKYMFGSFAGYTDDYVKWLERIVNKLNKKL